MVKSFDKNRNRNQSRHALMRSVEGFSTQSDDAQTPAASVAASQQSAPAETPARERPAIPVASPAPTATPQHAPVPAPRRRAAARTGDQTVRKPLKPNVRRVGAYCTEELWRAWKVTSLNTGYGQSTLLNIAFDYMFLEGHIEDALAEGLGERYADETWFG